MLHARRYLAGGGPVHPRQQHVVDDLAVFSRPYLSRLWARLHGRDVWQEPCTDVDEVRALLEGVARSVSLDHRQRIKAMLGTAGGRMRARRRLRSVDHRPGAEAVPLTSVLEVCGAVLSWTVDDPGGAVHIAFTDTCAGGLAVAGRRRGRAQRGGRELWRAVLRQGSWSSRASTSRPVRSSLCGGWRSAIGCGGGGLRAGATASPNWTARSSTARWHCSLRPPRTSSGMTALWIRMWQNCWIRTSRRSTPWRDRVIRGWWRSCAPASSSPRIPASLSRARVRRGHGTPGRLRAGCGCSRRRRAGPGDRDGCGFGELECCAAGHLRRGRGHRRLARRGRGVAGQRGGACRVVRVPGSPAGIAVRLRSGDINGAGVLDATGTATLALVRPRTQSGNGIPCLESGLA